MEAGMWWLQIGTNGKYFETLSWITRVDGFFTDENKYKITNN